MDAVGLYKLIFHYRDCEHLASDKVMGDFFMSIDINSEDLIRFAEAARCFPGRPICIQTLHRWRLHGVRGARLESCLIGGARFTSRQAIDRFIANQNAGDSSAAPVTPSQRAKQSEAARRELAKMGV